MQRRLDNHKEDPMEELLEVYEDVGYLEDDFKKSINIANFIIEKHNEAFEELIHLKEEFNQCDMEREAMVD